jgi:tetratricopeptide (TPR) repeat protein
LIQIKGDVMKIYVSLFLLFTAAVAAQMTDEDVRARLDLVHNGKIDQVRSEIASLRQQYPNDPGVAYIDAYVTEDGSLAAKKYQSVVDTYPNSSWADDALYRVYQYYYAVGLYKTADTKLEQLNRQYPNSLYAKKESTAPQRLAETPVPAQTPADPETASPSQQPESADAPVVQQSGGPYAVQVGVYSLEPTAIQQSNIMTQTVGRQASVFSKQSGGRTVFAVAFEGFETDRAARQFGSELKSKFNLDWFIVKR